MKKCAVAILLFCLFPWSESLQAQEGLLPGFPLAESDIELKRPARPGTYFDKAGRKFAVLGQEGGRFEAWAYPLKILRNFEFSFLLGTSTRPLAGRDIVRTISVSPAVTTLTFTAQSFTVRASFICSVSEPGAVILLSVDAVEPVTVVCGFLPVLQPMWPAGLGGQYAFWDKTLKAYLLSEPTRKNHGLVGSPAADGISYTPAHMLSDAPNEFKIVVSDPARARGKFLPLILAGGTGAREDVVRVYKKIEADPRAVLREAEEHYNALRDNTLRVRTPEKILDLAFEWAKAAYDNLFVDNPHLGLGMVAGLGTSGSGGRPGFGWFFGGDAYINSFSLNALGAYSLSKTALSFTRKWQREDGKMAHELSQAAGFIRWFEDYPYGYIHGDTTPFYIVAVRDYFRQSGDSVFVKESWNSLTKAFEWCLSTDGDGDGLMDNRRAGLGALEFGSLTGIQTDIYLAAVWVRAAADMSELAGVAGDAKWARQARKNHEKAAASFREKFWDEESGFYSYAFNADGKRVTEPTAWPAVGIFWGLGSPGHSERTLERLGHADMTADWGVRMLSTRSSLYEPLNYNYGAAWPYLSGWVTAAHFKSGRILQGFPLLLATARHTFDNALGCVTELFSGRHNVWPEEAVSHQGFSTGGFVLPFVRGLLGLTVDAAIREIYFEPRLPADWKEIAVENCRVGEAVVSLLYGKEEEAVRLKIRSGVPGLKLVFAPVLSPGTRVSTARLNGRGEPVHVSSTPTYVQPWVRVTLSGSDEILIPREPLFEVLPPRIESETGDMSSGLKLIRLSRMEETLELIVEGLSGRTYELSVLNPGLAAEVSGANLEGNRLVFAPGPGSEGEFLEHRIVVKMK